MMWLTWAIPLVVVIFLWTLNEFLRGRLKVIISGVLVWLIFGLCIAAFFVSGWVFGLAALVGSFVLGALLRYPSLLLARKLVQSPDLGVERYWQERHERMANDLFSPEGFERLEKEKREEASHMARTIDMALNRPDVQAILNKHSCSKQDVQALYQRVEILNLPPRLREQAVCNAKMLEYFLMNSVGLEIAGEYTRNVRDLNVSLTLASWAKRNPGGEAPR